MRECKDCIHYRVCNWHVDAFNCFFYKAPTEGARDYIEREPLLEFAKKYQGDTFSFPLLMRAIKDAPTVDVVPRNEVAKEFTCFGGDPHKVEHCPYLDEIEKAKAEVAREIINDLDGIKEDFILTDELPKACAIRYAMLQIENKYTEGGAE